MRAKDVTGLRVGNLTAEARVGSDGRRSVWRIRCDCGETRIMKLQNYMKLVREARPTSCGCRKKEFMREAVKTHGMTKHPAYAVWRSMNDRCRLPTHQAWANYGGRGITVCEAWRTSFEAFWRDMGPTYQTGLTLDRTNNEGPYSPENCRWVSSKEQARNTRRTVLVDTPLGRMTVSELAERTGIGATTLLYRVQRGVTGAALLEKPNPARKFSTL